ncbi:MAG: EAL domain-containing protein, partial [Psychrosphaera sp.]|nr:EAL domain-containing protein [Psychrosphaera sp.]
MKSSAEEIDLFYKEIHSIVNSLLFAKNFFIALYDESSELLNFPYYCDQFSDVDPTQSFSRNMLEHSLSGWVFRNQEPLLAGPQEVKDMQANGEIQIFGELAESWLGIPFDSGEHVKGVVVVQSYDKDSIYHERDKELLVFVSQHISHALDRIFSEQKLQHQALHDALTGFPNRVLFMDRVVHALDRLKRHNHESVSVMYLDLDKFKTINDSLGHLIGDQFLIKVAEVVADNIRTCDTLARLGGDEFAILLEDINEKSEAIEVADRVINALKQPIQVGEQKLATSVSIGVAFSERKLNAVELIKHADTAMYKAKEKGRATYCVFEHQMLADQSAYIRLDLEIKDALAKREFTLFYQPIYKTACSNIIGMEALVRWQHKEKGLIFPDEFIGYAEESNLIIGIDRYVMDQAAKQMAKWQDKFSEGFYISVNVSGKNFTSLDFVDYVMEVKEKYNLADGVFAIEITERALINNIEQAKVNLQILRERGIQILLDDFGTGYSSLSYLHQFPLDCLKIDRSFINDMNGSQFDNPLVKMIIALAKSLNL